MLQSARFAPAASQLPPAGTFCVQEALALCSAMRSCGVIPVRFKLPAAAAAAAELGMDATAALLPPLPPQQQHHHHQQGMPQARAQPLQGGLRDATNSFAHVSSSGGSGSGWVPAVPDCSASSLSQLAALHHLMLQRTQQQPAHPPALPVQHHMQRAPPPPQQQGGGLALGGGFPMAAPGPLSILQYSQLLQQLSALGTSTAAPPACQLAPHPAGFWPVPSAPLPAPALTYHNQFYQQQWQPQPQLVLLPQQRVHAPPPAPAGEREGGGSSPAHLQAILAALQSVRLQSNA